MSFCGTIKIKGSSMFRNKMNKLYLINDIDCYENNLALVT